MRAETESSDDGVRIWSQMTVKINLGDYESVELSLGSSVPVQGRTVASRKRMHRQLHQENASLIRARVAEVRRIWSNK